MNSHLNQETLCTEMSLSPKKMEQEPVQEMEIEENVSCSKSKSSFDPEVEAFNIAAMIKAECADLTEQSEEKSEVQTEDENAVSSFASNTNSHQ
jgi:hypothetical protein